MLQGLAVKVSAKVGDALRGFSRVDSAATDLSLSLRGLSNSADAAEDQLSAAGRSAATTSASFAGLSASTSGLSFSFGALTSSLTGTVGALAAVTAGVTGLLSTLFPLAAVVGTLTAGLGALAAAFGTVIGTGILAFGEKRGEQNAKQLKQIREKIARLEALQQTEQRLTATQQKRLQTLQEQANALEEQTGIMGGLQSVMEDLRKELEPIVTEFGEAFVPLIEEAVDLLPNLVDNILEAVGGLERFAEVLGNLGSEAFEILPQIAGVISDLAYRALPPFLDALSWLQQNGARIFNGMLRVTSRLAPVMMDLLRAFGNAVPELTALGTAILQKVIPALTGYFRLVEDIVNLGGNTNGLANTIRSLVTNAVAWVRGPGKKLLQNLGGTLLDTLSNLLTPGEGGKQGIVGAFTSTIGDIIEAAETWLNSKGGKQQLSSFATGIFDSLASQLSQIKKSDIQGAINALLSVVGGLFDALIVSLNSDEANSLGGQIGRVAGVALNSLADALIQYAGSKAFRNDLKGLSSAIANSVGIAIATGIFDAIGGKRKGASERFNKAFNNPLALYKEGFSKMFNASRNMGRDQLGIPQGGLPGSSQTAVNVTIEGELPEESIKNVSLETYQNETRKDIMDMDAAEVPRS